MNARPHVLHLRSSAGLYGAEHVILGLIPALARIGINSTLLCLDNPHLDEQLLWVKAGALGIRSERVPCHGRFDFATLAALRKTLAARPHPILHVHDYKSALNAWLARGTRRLPIVATAHGQYSSTPSLQLYHRLELALMTRFDRVCIVAEAMRSGLIAAGVLPSRICLIENGIDTEKFAPTTAPIPRWEFGIQPDAIVFGSVMRLTEQKNPLGLIEAFARVSAELPQAVLVIAGDGDMRGAVAHRIAELGLYERVRLIGPRNDLESFYPMLDVFVLPSLYEGLPLALLEAMAAECKIVATHVGEVGAVLRGLPAAVVRPGDIDALAKAMRDTWLFPRSTRALRERAIERYSLRRMATAYASVYRQVWNADERAAA